MILSLIPSFLFFFTTIDDTGLSRNEFGLMELHYYRLFIYYILDYLYLGLVSTCLNSSYLYPELCECCVVILFLLFKILQWVSSDFFFTQVYLNVQVWCRLELHVYNIFFSCSLSILLLLILLVYKATFSPCKKKKYRNKIISVFQK